MILHKYMRHLRYIDQGSIVHLDAVELALRLALDELEQSIASTPSTPPTELATLQADLERLQTAANAEVADLKQQIAELDTDNAALIRRNKELVDSLHISQNGTGLAVKNPPFVDSAPSAISNQQSPINNSMWSDPNMLNTLDDIARDWWIGVAAGRHQWRSVPKPVQLQLVRHVLSFGPETGSMKMTDFDAIKPDWMPGSGSHTKTLNLSWSQLNDWSVEL
jgi:hypothetical protein